jgi:hypothetical protein
MDSLEVKPGYTSQDRCILGYKKRSTIDRELRLLAPNHAVKDFRRDECALRERAVSSSALPLGGPRPLTRKRCQRRLGARIHLPFQIEPDRAQAEFEHDVPYTRSRSTCFVEQS